MPAAMTAPARCGDGVIYAGVEECDDGNTADNDACRNDCTPARCGDGIIQAGVEECDDGNADDTDACLSSCVEAHAVWHHLYRHRRVRRW